MSEELKACPFCGVIPKLVSLVTPVRYFYQCPNCGIGSETQGFDRNEAVNLWNTRPLEDAKDAEIARLTSRLAELEQYKAMVKELADTLRDLRRGYEYLDIESDGQCSVTLYEVDNLLARVAELPEGAK